MAADIIDFGPVRPGAKSPSARIRILKAFADRLRDGCIKDITMTDLAAGLGMSKKTLYENFANKEDVLRVTMELWIEALHRVIDEAIREHGDPNEMIRAIASGYLDCLDRFSPEFWPELIRDFPEVNGIIARAMSEVDHQTRRAVQGHLREGLAPRVALETYQAMIARAWDPDVTERLGMSRRDLIVQFLDVWSNGALRTSRVRDDEPR